MKNVLVVDNQISVCDLLFKFLTRENYQVVTTTRGQSALEISQKHNFDLVIADYHLPDMDGKVLFDELQKHAPATPMILMGREVTLKNAVAMIRRGAKNFIAKPLNPDELLEAMNESNDTLRDPQPHPLREKQPAASATSLMSPRCAKVKAILDQVKRVGPTNFSVIIQGETGTGKESLARQIHHVSNRKHGPFEFPPSLTSVLANDRQYLLIKQSLPSIWRSPNHPLGRPEESIIYSRREDGHVVDYGMI